MKCRVTKGGWMWKGAEQVVGTELDESPEWIANRVRDGLVESAAAGDAVEPVIEQAVAVPDAEVAVAPRQRGKTKKQEPVP